LKVSPVRNISSFLSQLQHNVTMLEQDSRTATYIQ